MRFNKQTQTNRTIGVTACVFLLLSMQLYQKLGTGDPISSEEYYSRTANCQSLQQQQPSSPETGKE